MWRHRNILQHTVVLADLEEWWHFQDVNTQNSFMLCRSFCCFWGNERAAWKTGLAAIYEGQPLDLADNINNLKVLEKCKTEES